MKISICIPTYNRGHRALECVENLLELPYDEEKLEIVVSDNGSEKHTEEYERLASIDDDRLVYHRFDGNKGFLINLNQVVKMSTGDFCMILSDEDIVDLDLFDYYYNQILGYYPEVHIVRPRSDVQYPDMPYYYGKTDVEALEAFFCNGNYISGTFFDRKLLTNDVVDYYYERYKNNRAYQDYPHLFYGAELLIKGGFYCDEYPLIHEGVGEEDSTYDKEFEAVKIQHYGTYEKRLEQMDGFVDLINDINTNDARKFQMLQLLCIKTSYLVTIVKVQYLAVGTDWNNILEKEKKDMKAIARKTILPFDESDWRAVDRFIDEIIDERG